MADTFHMATVSKRTLTVLLIDDDPEFAELVRIWLAPNDDVGFQLQWSDSLVEGLNSLTQGGVDVVLLDLGLPDSSGYETFLTTRSYTSAVPIIVLSSTDSEPLAVRMVHQGAQDYIIKSTCTPSLLSKALQFAAVRRTTPATGVPPGDQTRVIGVMGVKGGVGTTTIACSLAVEMRQQSKQSTLLVDLNLDSGLVGFLMNAESDYSIVDAVNNLHRLDRSCWNGIVAHDPSGLDILRSPALLGGNPPEVDKLRHVLTLIRTFYQWIIVDFGRLSEVSSHLLDRADELLLVTRTSVPALYEAKRSIAAVKKARFEGDRLRLIVNQQGTAQDFRGSELDLVFGIPVYAKLSSAPKELHDAFLRGRLPEENGNFRTQIANLARLLRGVEEPRKKSVFSQMFSFSDKPGKSVNGAPSASRT